MCALHSVFCPHFVVLTCTNILTYFRQLEVLRSSLTGFAHCIQLYVYVLRMFEQMIVTMLMTGVISRKNALERRSHC